MMREKCKERDAGRDRCDRQKKTERQTEIQRER